MKKTLALTLLAVSLFAFVRPAAQITYQVDTHQSKVVWKGKKVTGEHSGNVSLAAGSLVVADGKLKGGSFETDLRTLTVTDLTDKDYNAKLVGHLKGDDFFAVEKHPVSKFVITRVAPQSGDQVTISGKLTIKGITQEISFPATVKADASKLTASAKIPVDRTKFDIKYRSANFFENLGDKAISNDFELDVTLVAPAASGAQARK